MLSLSLLLSHWCSSNAKGDWYAVSAGGSFTPHVIIVDNRNACVVVSQLMNHGCFCQMLPKLPVQLKVPLIATVALEATTSIQGCCF
jgi:hypothetical protein